MKQYCIIVEPGAQIDLESIFNYISQNDSARKAKIFFEELKTQIQTFVFKVIDVSVYILTIFRQKNF